MTPEQSSSKPTRQKKTRALKAAGLRATSLLTSPPAKLAHALP